VQKLKPKALIFDLGSTLIDFPVSNWDEVSRECSLAGYGVLWMQGVQLPTADEFLAEFEEVRSELRNVAASTYQEWNMVQAAKVLFSRLGIKSDGGEPELFFDAFYKQLESHLSLYDDTIEILTRAKKRFKKVGLISNTIFPERVHHHEFDRFGLNSFFDFAIFSSTFGLRKPHPDIFVEAARLAETKPSDCVYIGDRYLEDVQGSQGAGMSAILKVVSDRAYPSEMPDVHRKITNLRDLAVHLDI
jgi:putative hydrolase of the HAD superfamily